MGWRFMGLFHSYTYAENYSVADDYGQQMVCLDLEAELSNRIYKAMYSRYSELPDEPIVRRVERELFFMELFEMSHEFLVFHDFALFLRGRHIPYWLNGATSSSFLLFLLGISSANPLPPHYLCPHCKSLIWDDSCKDGFDLPERECECGPYERDGHDIRMESYWGLELEKERLKDSQHDLNIMIPMSAHQEMYDFLTRHPLLQGEEFRQIIVPTYKKFNARHISVSAVETFFPGRSEPWFRPLCADNVKKSALEYVKADEQLSCIADAGYPQDALSTFYGALKVHGLCHDSIWSENGEYLVADKAADIEELPAYYDDFYEILERHFPMREAWKEVERMHWGKGLTESAAVLSNFNWMEDYTSKIRYMFSKAHNVEWLIAKCKGGKAFTEDWSNRFFE